MVLKCITSLEKLDFKNMPHVLIENNNYMEHNFECHHYDQGHKVCICSQLNLLIFYDVHVNPFSAKTFNSGL